MTHGFSGWCWLQFYLGGSKINGRSGRGWPPGGRHYKNVRSAGENSLLYDLKGNGRCTSLFGGQDVSNISRQALRFVSFPGRHCQGVFSEE